jgi:hypothetical protein
MRRGVVHVGSIGDVVANVGHSTLGDSRLVTRDLRRFSPEREADEGGDGSGTAEERDRWTTSFSIKKSF